MPGRVFWIYSNGKRVREISFEKFQEMHRNPRYTLIMDWKTEIAIVKGKTLLVLKKRQLEEVLRDGDVS